jgi:glycosyltransferase involved in cell wall biosynthesis
MVEIKFMSNNSSKNPNISNNPETFSSGRLSRPISLINQSWPDSAVPVVSVLCVTYNHVNFIRDAIESFLIQETTFPVEIVIHDDASTDGTTKTLIDYQKKYPSLIRNIIQTKNQWPRVPGAAELVKRYCSGKYIALCEGDDYWTDSEKLEIQYNYLNNNPACSGCFHQSRLVDENNRIIKTALNKFDREIYSATEAFQSLQSSYATNSLFFRNNFEMPLPDWYTSKPNDMALEVLLTQYGSLGYIDRNMSDYRKHSGGVWSQTSPEMQYFELMHRLQLWIDDPSFPNELKTEVRKKFTEVQEDRPSNHLIRELQERLKFANQETEMIRGSLSWKITEPLRYFHNLFKRKSG